MREKYIKYINKILKNLQNIDLYLNINKYKFYIKQIKYLRLIIIIKELKINSQKINTIKN